MRIALLISGSGTTATAILNAIKTGELAGVEPACVIASRPTAPGIERLAQAGFPKDKIYVASPRSETFGAEILRICSDNKVDFIGQYGWLAMTPESVIEQYKSMMVNQHDGPLDPGRPDFGGEGMYGLRVSCARLLFVRKTNHDFWTEATAQRVAVHFDEGSVVKTARVPILEKDTPETLAARLLPVEHQVEIDTLCDFANGTVKEIKREVPLVAPNEIEILRECKKEALLTYPRR